MGQVIAEEALVRTVRERQQAGERAVFTNGCFDLLHLGHVTYLRRARALGDFLVIGLNSDDSTRRLKGPRRPLTPEQERAEVLAALAFVDYVTIFGDNTAGRLIGLLQPAIYAKGGDYAGQGQQHDFLLAPAELQQVLAGQAAAYPELAHLAQRLPEAPIVADYGGSLALLTYLPEHSTTELIQRIVSRYAHFEAPQAGSSPNASQSSES